MKPLLAEIVQGGSVRHSRTCWHLASGKVGSLLIEDGRNRKTKLLLNLLALLALLKKKNLLRLRVLNELLRKKMPNYTAPQLTKKLMPFVQTPELYKNGML